MWEGERSPGAAELRIPATSGSCGRAELSQVKPAQFEYLCPKTSNAAIELLAQYGGDARILAGGQSLVPMLNFRIARFGYLIDINNIDELDYIRLDQGWLRLGALARYRTIEACPIVAQAAPLLSRATKFVAHLPIRTRGTVGGSLAHADPGAEYPAVMLALDAELVLRSTRAERIITIADFIQGMFTTALEPDELLVEVRLPIARGNQIFGFEEFARRPGDLAVIGVAVKIDLDAGRAANVRVVILGGPHGARRVPEAEAALEARQLGPDQIACASDAASRIEAHTDIHATDALRRHLAGVLTRRALTSALSMRPAA